MKIPWRNGIFWTHLSHCIKTHSSMLLIWFLLSCYDYIFILVFDQYTLHNCYITISLVFCIRGWRPLKAVAQIFMCLCLNDTKALEDVADEYRKYRLIIKHIHTFKVSVCHAALKLIPNRILTLIFVSCIFSTWVNWSQYMLLCEPIHVCSFCCNLYFLYFCSK